ncbi:MAG: phage tail protein, partial [Clostridiales bacterium]|nr:phage tail protein [Clostridiales bacterium]
MYRVTIYNGSTATIIHEPSVDPADPHLYPCSLVQGSSGEIDTLSFEILPNNPGYELLASRTTMVTAYNTVTGKNEFSGRVLTITPQMDSSGLIYKSVTCEDRLGFLCDSVQPYTAEATYTLEDFFKLLLENHNAQVEDYKKIYPGTISATASASTGNVTKGLNYQTTWEALNEKLLDTEGGEIQLYEGTDGLLYLDYVDELGSISDTTIELGKNMTSISQEIDPTDVITRLIPLGANLEADDDDSDVDTNAKTTIESVNNGSLWIDDEEAQAVYGIVVGTVEWEDVTEPSNLLTKANAWLEAQTVTDKVTLTALDLSIIGLDADAIERYNYYRTVNAAIGLDAYLRVVKCTTNICDPSDKSFEMGERNSSLSSTLTGANKTAGSAAADAVAAINGQLSKTVTALIVSNATIIQLQSTLAEIETAYITTADVETLLAGYAYITTADVESLLADCATISDLDAATANITDLTAEVANINSLLSGNIGAGTVQTIHLSADNTVIDTALIETIYAANGIISDLVAG